MNSWEGEDRGTSAAPAKEATDSLFTRTRGDRQAELSTNVDTAELPPIARARAPHRRRPGEAELRLREPLRDETTSSPHHLGPAEPSRAGPGRAEPSRPTRRPPGRALDPHVLKTRRDTTRRGADRRRYARLVPARAQGERIRATTRDPSILVPSAPAGPERAQDGDRSRHAFHHPHRPAISRGPARRARSSRVALVLPEALTTGSDRRRDGEDGERPTDGEECRQTLGVTSGGRPVARTRAPLRRRSDDWSVTRARPVRPARRRRGDILAVSRGRDLRL